jgi:hypothetical protein
MIPLISTRSSGKNGLSILASTVKLGFWSRWDRWPYLCSFQYFYVLWNGASSSTRGGVWLQLVTPPPLWMARAGTQSLIGPFSHFIWMWDEPHRKRRVQQFSYCWVCIHCCRNVFTKSLPSNDRGDTHIDTQTARWSHKPTFISSKQGKQAKNWEKQDFDL